MADRNLLSNETSPYLLQHQDNPVHWRPWGADALKAARDEDKPVLLSIGYAACHWCHVMAHESFEDPETAEIMNRLFINIKVDREERPDLDAIYQSTLQLLGQQGGWPLTMFLTPDGEPFWGGTYFPDTPRYGMPSFRQLLKGVSSTYQQKSDDITKNVDALRDGLAKMSAGAGAGDDDISLAQIDAAATALLRAVDPVNGGLNGAPKFPQPCIFKFLWRAGLRTGNPDLKQAVIRTLDAMSQGGIYDHLGGGYARYSTDDEWLAPQFEKMLYDNAQLIDLLVDVWRGTGSDLYETRIRECINWLEREMIADGGAFSSTIDADSEGEEGRFYVWQEAEIDALLGDDSPVFKAAYDVSP
ncbi:MAG: thioredoxin domain-containing protein, partial [Rhodospirillales bacterium]